MSLLGDQRGAMTVPLSLALLATATAAFGICAVMHNWRQKAETQIRLDRCVGKTALELKQIQTKISESNRAIQSLRIALAAAALTGSAATLRVALEAAARLQDLELARWTARQGLWLALRGCDSLGDWPEPLPSLGWARPPPDALGPRPLQRSGDPSLLVQLLHPPRAAAAAVMSPKETGGTLAQTWKAVWISPKQLGPSTH